MKNKCPQCGKETKGNMKFCPSCGEKLEVMNEEKRRKPKKPIVLAGILAVIVCVICLAALSQPKIVSISAAYEGETTEGTVLNKENKGIVVTGVDQNGETKELSSWQLEEEKTLEADGSADIHITYKDLEKYLTVECSTSELVDFTVSYDGSKEAGVVIDDSSTDMHLTAEYKNGTEEEIEAGWTIENPVTLESDSTSDVEIEYGGLRKTYSIACSTVTVTGIKATYSGDTDAGTIIDEDSDDIEVTATYKDGSKKTVSDWELDKKRTLKAGKTSKFTISYQGQKCTLKVKCTTLTKKQYKASCKDISYDKLARDPDKYLGTNVKFTGEVVQVMESSGEVALRINVNRGKYGYYEDTVYAAYIYEDGESKILEDDIVTFYGTSLGLTSYESVLGATITIPSVYAKYIER